MNKRLYILTILGISLFDRILKFLFFNSAVFGYRSIQILIFSALVTVLLKYILKVRSQLLWFEIMMIGAVSNIIDQLIYNKIIDYIPFFFNYYINFSDILISVGGLILLFELTIYGTKSAKSK